MTTPFSFEHVFRAPSLTALVDAYFDAEHLAAQDRVAKLERTVIALDVTDARREGSWRVTSLQPLPAIARPFVRGGRLAFVEAQRWTTGSDAVEMSVVPDLLGGRVQITGTYQLTELGDGRVRRIYAGTITAALPLVGGKIERGILETFTEQVPAMAAVTQTWLDR